MIQKGVQGFPRKTSSHRNVRMTLKILFNYTKGSTVMQQIHRKKQP